MSCDGINGYDVRLYHPQSVQQNLTRSVNGNFYIVKDEDRLVNTDHNTVVQVTVSVYTSRCPTNTAAWSLML